MIHFVQPVFLLEQNIVRNRLKKQREQK